MSNFSKASRLPLLLSILLIIFARSAPLAARGPLSFEGESAVSIYRDFDDGLFGRSLYRGVIFSVKLGSFSRYRSLPIRDLDGLSAYMVSSSRAEAMAAGPGRVATVPGMEDAADSDPLKWEYRLDKDGIRIRFSLEKVPDDFYEEIERAYPEYPGTAQTVSDTYRNSYVIRIHEAENVFQPQFAVIDYEDILISASLVGDDFQPLWGIHDGNSLAP